MEYVSIQNELLYEQRQIRENSESKYKFEVIRLVSLSTKINIDDHVLFTQLPLCILSKHGFYMNFQKERKFQCSACKIEISEQRLIENFEGMENHNQSLALISSKILECINRLHKNNCWYLTQLEDWSETSVMQEETFPQGIFQKIQLE